MDKRLEHDFITTEQACSFLGIKKPTLYNKISAGIIPVYKVAKGNVNRYRIRDLEKLFEKR
jgi:excisionase family DNA binding protein